MPSGIDPKVDYVFKRLCGSEENALMLVDVINAVINPLPGRRVTGVSINNPFTQQGYAEGKTSIFDVLASDDPGRRYHLEMQLFIPAFFAKRLLYYWAAAYHTQLLQGENYATLQGTYSICFANENLLPDSVWHHRFRLFDAEHQCEFPSDLEIHFIELPKFNLTPDQLQTQLERWVWFFRNGASLDLNNLPATLDLPIFRQAVEVLMQIGQDPLSRAIFDDRLRAQRDAASHAAELRDARAAARDAHRLGHEEGLEEGQLLGEIRAFQKLLRLPLLERSAFEQLSVQDREILLSSLEAQLRPKTNGA